MSCCTSFRKNLIGVSLAFTFLCHVCSYDLGYKENWESVLGPNKLLWFVPVNMHLKQGDGLAFRRIVQQVRIAEDETAAAAADEIEIELGILNREQAQVL